MSIADFDFWQGDGIIFPQYSRFFLGDLTNQC
jgi:hypothetical protein